MDNPVEKGLRVVIIPSISEEEERRMSRRNYRRTVLDKARVFGVSGITYAEFMTKSVTEQFLILRKFIPDNWRPAAINVWYEDAKIDEEAEVFSGVVIEQPVDETALGEALRDNTP